jgi:hypothetical protein
MKKIAIFLNTFSDAVILLVYKVKKIKEKFLSLFKKHKNLIFLIPFIFFLIIYLVSSIYKLITINDNLVLKILSYVTVFLLLFLILIFLKIALEISFTNIFKSNKSKFRDEIDEIQNTEKSIDTDEINDQKSVEVSYANEFKKNFYRGAKGVSEHKYYSFKYGLINRIYPDRIPFLKENKMDAFYKYVGKENELNDVSLRKKFVAVSNEKPEVYLKNNQKFIQILLSDTRLKIFPLVIDFIKQVELDINRINSN